MNTFNLYANRFEKSFIYKSTVNLNVLKSLLKKITQSEPLSEVLATTYFDPVNNFSKNKSTVLRFRQRSNLDISKEYQPPHIWFLKGDGVIEIKTKDKESMLTKKKGIFLNINKNKRKGGFVEVDLPWVLKHTKKLEPYITRVSKRYTYKDELDNLKITLESKPALYPYTLSSRKKFKAKLFEESNVVKIDIKSIKRGVFNKTINFFNKFKKQTIQSGRESNTPYSKMIIEASKRDGSIFIEKQGKEIESKATLPPSIKLVELIKLIKTEIVKNNNYKPLKFDPNISSRGEHETSRTIIGYKNKNCLNEVVTVIRLSKEAKNIFGFLTVLKWKSNNLRDKKILNRNVGYEYLTTNPSDEDVMRKTPIYKKLQVICVLKKMKYRIAIQDMEGRCWIVSLDKTESLGSKKFIKQLEVEYCWTEKGMSRKISLEQGCIKCIDQIIKLIGDIKKINLTKTNLRKIDFFHA